MAAIKDIAKLRLTQQRLREVIDYNPDTGAFMWRARPATAPKERSLKAGSIYNTGHRYLSIDGEVHRAARLAWLYVTGEWPSLAVKHANGDKADDRFANLILYDPPPKKVKEAGVPRKPRRRRTEPWPDTKFKVTPIPGEPYKEWKKRWKRERFRILMATDPEFRRKCSEHSSRMAKKYPERHAARCAAARARDPEKYKNLARGAVRRRRARLLGSEGSHTQKDIDDIRKAQKDKCALCKCRLHKGGHLDHIQPISKGGSSYKRNLQWLCATCNQRKSAKDPIEFAQEQGLLL